MPCWSRRALVVTLLCVVCTSLQPLLALDTTYATHSAAEVCTASEVAQPESTEAVSALVKKAGEAGQKVKVVGTRHSTTDMVCTSGLALDLSRINDVKISAESMEVTAGAGATQEQVLERLTEEGFTVIQPFARYSGLSMGGVLAAGAISSSIKHPASLSDQVISLTLVDGLGKIHKIIGEDLKAARLNLGYLGVITDVTMKIVPNFKTKLEATRHDESILFDGSVNTWAAQADYLEVFWFPYVHTAIVLNGTFQDITTPGTDMSRYIFEATPNFIQELDDASASRNADFYCKGEEANAQGWIEGHPGIPQMVTKDGDFTNPATGLMADILTSSCPLGQCAWDNPFARLLSQEVHLAIPLDVFSAALQTTRSIIDKRPMCALGISGITLRFQGPSSNYLSIAHGTALGHLEILQPLRQEDNQSHYGQATMQEIYQTVILNFRARPHWGKNARSSFAEPLHTLEELYPDWPKFLAVKKRLDPEGIFENDFYERLTGKKGIEKGRYCATDDKCVCSENFHCAEGQKCEIVLIGNVKGGVCID